MSVKNAVHKTSGYAAAAALSALLVKYPLRKLGMHKANAALMQAHEAASGAYFLAALLHMATSPKTSGCKAASGAAAFAVSVVLIADCHMGKGSDLENAAPSYLFRGSGRCRRPPCFLAALYCTSKKWRRYLLPENWSKI